MIHDRSAPDAAEFEELIAAEGGRLFAVAFSILGDPGYAEDAVQETASAAWRGWSTRTDSEHTRAWLTAICVHQALRRRRWLGRSLAALSRKAARTQVDMHLGADGRYVDLHRAFSRLSRQQKAVVSLHYMSGFTLTECADLMGCSAGAAASHLSRALAKLRKELQRD
ncbi:MAG: sigma-70 family RNA polymerase sigma factor [Candidatus Dormiibacterota bacterium]